MTAFPQCRPPLYGWRSISGLPLDGDRVTREAHIDDGGVDHKEPFFVVAGVITHPDAHDAKIEEDMFAISKELRPDKPYVRLHAKDIWGGGKDFHKDLYPACADRAVRQGKLLKLIKLIEEHHAPVVFGVANKRNVRPLPKANRLPGRAYIDDVEALSHIHAQLSCSVRIEYWMQQNTANEIARLTHEDIPRKKKWLEIAHNYCREPEATAWPYAWKPPIEGMIPFVKIRGQIRWANPFGERMLQLADVCAFVISKHLRRDPHIGPYFDALRHHLVLPDEIEELRETPIRRDDGED